MKDEGVPAGRLLCCLSMKPKRILETGSRDFLQLIVFDDRVGKQSATVIADSQHSQAHV
jgi:hypothetical protein